MTITSGSWINTKPGVDLVIQSDASIIVESGAEFCVDSNSKCAVWGDLSAQNGGKVIEDGTLYKLDSELVQYLSECCGSMTAAQICRQLQNIDQEALLVELREDFYCWWDYRKHLKLLESQIGGPATVVLEEDVAFFSEGNFKIQGANLNMPLDINQPIRVKVGYKDISGSDYLVGFSLELENVKDRKHSTVPLDITVTMPDGFSANGITLVKYRPDGSTEQVPLEKLGSQVQFVITELGEYALDYAKSGKLNSSISWTFETTTGTLTISGSGAIPNSVKWGNLDAKIRRAVIEEGITSLGSSLFSDLKMLEEVSLPVSLTRIENDVFYSSSLKSVIIPQNVTYIGDYAFGYMENLISVVFQGNAPEFYSKYTNKNNFYSVTATIYYPAGNSTWTESVRQNYGGTLTWVAGCTNGHTIVVTKGKDPTCTEPGISDSKICSACGAVLAVVSELEPLGHNMISDGEVPATCTAPGLQAGAHCSRCDYSEGRTEIPALGHTEVVDDYVAPTCTQTGLTKGSHCSRCNKTLVRQNVIDALGHNFVDAVCTVCGAGEVLEGISYDGLSWKIDEKGKLTITGEGDMYYTPWKNYADRIRTVEICSGSTRIYWDAFSGCTKLTKVTMADTVTEIGASAFEGCTSLTSIAIPTGVSAIEYCTFKDCISLTSISIPGSVTEIGWNAFEGCTSLCSMSLPQGLKVIESSVFEGCTALTSIEIPKTVKEIGGGAFSGCTNLLSANIPSGVEIVEYSTFDGCSSLSQITIPATVKEIESHAFRNCTSLTFVTVPQGVTTLGVGAFRGCTALYGVSLPKSLKTVEYDLFADCTSLCEVTIPAGLTELGDWMFSGCESLVKITIPNTVTTIGRAAFSNCSSLKEITLPASVTTLGSRAFINCGSLKSIKVSDSNAFFSADMYGVLYNKDKTVLVCIPGGTTGNYTIPEGVVVTEESAAANSTKLTGITFPSTLTTIEKYAFSNCSALMDVWFLNNAPVIVENAFEGTTLTARYQTGDGTWTPEILQNYGGSITWVASCVNDHAKVTQFGIPATCTEEGISDGEYCSLCGDILIRQEVIPALGHVEVIDKGFVPTCTETGLTEGKHCDRCGEVYVAQEVIPALGHEFAAQNGEIVCAVCGETVTIHIHQDYVALDIYENPQVQLYVDIAPANLTAYLSWSAEGNDGILQFDQNGLITALRAGTAYVVAELTVDGYTISSRCRVDATEHVQILGIQLSTDKVTTELYKDDFATFEILLDLPQNHPFTGDELVVTDEAAMSASGLENKSNLIESVQFKTISDLFELVLLDDRTVQIVPTQKAMESGKTLKSSYTDTVIVKIKGEEEPREEELKLTLTVKKTLPKPKAKINAFNSFYEGQSQEIVITGVDVTGIRANESKNTGKTVAIPNWLTLEEGKLTLNGNTPKSSDKAYLWVDVEGWRYPAELTLSVKHARKVPGIKLAATTVTVADRNASTEVELKLLCTNKNDTLKDLNITGITVPKDYSIENINVDDGTFTLKKEGGFTSDRITLTVAYGSATKDLTLNVKTQLVKLKLSSTKVSLNKELNDVATVAVNCLTMGYELVNPTLTYDSTILDVRYQDHKLVVGLKDAAIEGKTYPVTISAYQGAPVAKLNVAVLKKGSVVKSTIKATGTLDVIREGTAITVKPTYTNYLNVNVDTDAVLKIYSSKDSFKKAIAEVYAENGIFTIDSSVISNHVLKYKAQLETKLPGKAEPIKSNQISLSVKMGAAKLTTGSSGTTMFAKDRNDRALVWFEAADASLNDVKTIQIKDAKYKDVFEIIDYRDGSFAICFKDGKIHESIAKQLEKKSSISITLNLNVFIEGNETVDPAISKTAKANATQKVNLTILK